MKSNGKCLIFLHGSIELFKGKRLSPKWEKTVGFFFEILVQTSSESMIFHVLGGLMLFISQKKNRQFFEFVGSKASPWIALSIHEKKLDSETSLHAEMELRSSKLDIYIW